MTNYTELIELAKKQLAFHRHHSFFESDWRVADNLKSMSDAITALVAERDALQKQVNPEMVDHYQALQEECDDLRAELDAMKGQEPVAWRFVDDEDGGHVSYRSDSPSWTQIEYLAKWNRPSWEPLYASPQPAPEKQEPLKDHEVAQLVNRLTAIAVEFHGAQQLRERIAQEIRPIFTRSVAEKQEPKCVAIIDVYDHDWHMTYLSLPVGRHKLYDQHFTTAPQPAQQEPDIYVHNEGTEVWGAKANPGFGNNPNYTAYYKAPQPAQQDNTELLRQALDALHQVGSMRVTPLQEATINKIKEALHDH